MSVLFGVELGQRGQGVTREASEETRPANVSKLSLPVTWGDMDVS
jgi:hypothetical protein